MTKFREKVIFRSFVQYYLICFLYLLNILIQRNGKKIMGISNVLSLLCGLALFLYGMGVMGDALKKSAGRKLKTILGNLTSNKFKGFLLGLGIASGIAMALSAVYQGKAGAAGADALAETGKGFSQYITVVGLCETVALFALVFSIVALG